MVEENNCHSLSSDVKIFPTTHNKIYVKQKNSAI